MRRYGIKAMCMTTAFGDPVIITGLKDCDHARLLAKFDATGEILECRIYAVDD